MQTQIDMVSFTVLKHAREAKQLAFEALKKAQAGDMEAAKALLKQSEDTAGIAQAASEKLFTFDLTGREYHAEHSQDHLMSSLLATEMVREMVDQYEESTSLQ